jgi:hypothetical protein
MSDGLALPDVLPEVRRPARSDAVVDPAWRWRIVGAIVLAHLLLLLAVDASLGLREPLAPRSRDEGVVIRWIEAESAVAAESAPTDAAPVALAPTTPRPQEQLRAPTSLPPAAASAASPSAVVDAETRGAGALPSRLLFDPDGRLRVSQSVVDAAAARPSPGYATPTRDGLPPIRSPIPYRKTRFDDDWVPDGETLGDEVMRKVAVEREFKTPWGTRWRCAIVLVFAACGDVPPAPMRNPPKMPWETYVEDAVQRAAPDF